LAELRAVGVEAGLGAGAPAAVARLGVEARLAQAVGERLTAHGVTNDLDLAGSPRLGRGAVSLQRLLGGDNRGA